jgi:hypothetical protein
MHALIDTAPTEDPRKASSGRRKWSAHATRNSGDPASRGVNAGVQDRAPAPFSQTRIMLAEDEGEPRPIVDAVANGSAIDWSARFDAAGAEEKEQLRALRAIAGIAGFHRERASDDSTGSLGDALSAHAPPVDPHAPPDLSHAETWGPLQVLERIDGGSFGDVFKAWDPNLAKIVALKRTRYSTPADAARAVSEAQRLASIPPHPNVITVFGACDINGVVGIWMEFLRGRTLRQLVEDQGELGAVEATHYGECLCRALAHAHAAFVLHRDVKAANVMKAAGGHIVLIDFGSGDDTTPLGGRTTNRLVGTLAYMAPELLRGQAPSPQSDIYSLGVLLFNLVTGTYPVTGRSRDDFERAHKNGQRALLSDVRSDLPLDFVRVVERAIAPDPAKRYRSAGEFLHDLVPPPHDQEKEKGNFATEWAKPLAWSALLIGCGLMTLGAINSRFYNRALGRSAFADDSPLEWLRWGALSLVAPVVLSLLALLALMVCTEGVALLVARSRHARSIAQVLGGWARRLSLEDVSVLGFCALFGSALGLVGVCYYFAFSDPMFSRFVALYPNISTAPGKALAFLAPRFCLDDLSNVRVRYRDDFAFVIVLCVVLWYPAIRVAIHKREAIHRGIAIGGAAVLILSLLILDFPYKLIASVEARHFHQVQWRGATCFIIGDKQIDLLLFCPGEPPPRNRIVRKSDPDLEDMNKDDDVFIDVEKLQ